MRHILAIVMNMLGVLSGPILIIHNHHLHNQSIINNIKSIYLQLRLMRVFKLAQTWSTMRRILAIVMNTLGALANLTLVLAIIIYIFAIIGMQLFSGTYTKDKFDPDEKPRYVIQTLKTVNESSWTDVARIPKETSLAKIDKSIIVIRFKSISIDVMGCLIFRVTFKLCFATVSF